MSPLTQTTGKEFSGAIYYRQQACPARSSTTPRRRYSDNRTQVRSVPGRLEVPERYLAQGKQPITRVRGESPTGTLMSAKITRRARIAQPQQRCQQFPTPDTNQYEYERIPT